MAGERLGVALRLPVFTPQFPGRDMRKTKSFKAGETLDSVAHFAKVAADELTGDRGEQALPARVRITVETIKNDLLIDPLLAELDLADVRDVVEEWLDFRRDELRKPVNSIRALKRSLNEFAGRPGALRAAVAESIKRGWTGLFDKSNGSPAVTDRRAKPMEGGDDGGTW